MQQCESCHVDSGNGYPPYMPPMAGNPPVMDPDPASLINIVLNGSSRLVVDGTPDAYRMPGYRTMLSDQQIADIVTFVRQGWGNNASVVGTADVAAFKRSHRFGGRPHARLAHEVVRLLILGRNSPTALHQASVHRSTV